MTAPERHHVLIGGGAAQGWQWRPSCGDAEGFSRTHKLSIGAALFPLLDPGGKGAFKTGDNLEGLLSQRIHLLSAPFTLIKEYLLVMFHVRRLMCAAHAPWLI